MIRAIETTYNGYRFRSRLEARWAVFFEQADIPYEYEPEGFDLNGLYYLPDFFLPDQKLFIEIKPTEELTEVEIRKAAGLEREFWIARERIDDTLDELAKEVLAGTTERGAGLESHPRYQEALASDPYRRCHYPFIYVLAGDPYYDTGFSYTVIAFECGGSLRTKMTFTKCPKCRTINFRRVYFDETNAQYWMSCGACSKASGKAERVYASTPVFWDSLSKAYRAARAERFGT